jgi:hypothetical protein
MSDEEIHDLLPSPGPHHQSENREWIPYLALMAWYR